MFREEANQMKYCKNVLRLQEILLKGKLMLITAPSNTENEVFFTRTGSGLLPVVNIFQAAAVTAE